MTDNEKAFLWSKRHICSQRNSRLHLVLGSAPQWRPQNLPEIYSVLERWSPVSAEEALFLLSDEYIYNPSIFLCGVMFSGCGPDMSCFSDSFCGFSGVSGWFQRL